jgi:energy-coupling factor transport system ATP-binding protein
MITHGMNLVADFAKRVIVVNDGKVSLDSSVKEVFSRSDILSEAGVVPPQVTQLAQSLQKFGVPSNILTVDEFIDFITKKVP